MIGSIERLVDGWRITISDNGILGRNKENPNKLNYQQSTRTCMYQNCNNTIRINRTSGLCDEHKKHQHDLLLKLENPNGAIVSVPSHQDIIDALMTWSLTRNFSLNTFFSNLSFNILGNIPDVSTLAGEVVHPRIELRTLEEIYTSLSPIIHTYFPEDNTSSYQNLSTSRTDISAIVLANVFVGLLICEESNRGDRWFCRNVMRNESKTSQLGAAMPIAYYAAKSFPWGVEMNKRTARNL